MADTILIPDATEREQAISPEASFIVQAPAGSGKTTLLIQRYLVLLAIVERPEEILAITFTRKAAGEMHSRIVAVMEMASSNEAGKDPNEAATIALAQKVLSRDREMGWRLLENTARLKVMTIDSFCASLTRQMPLLSGLGRQLGVSESPDELYAEAARRTIALVGRGGSDGEALRYVLRHMDNSVGVLARKLTDMLRSRDQWLRHVDVDINDDELRARREDGIRNLVEDRLRRAASIFPEDLMEGVLVSARYAAGALLEADPLNRICLLDGIKELPTATAEELDRWKAIANLLLTGKGQWRKPAGVNKKIGFLPGKKTGDVAGQRKEAFKELLGEFEGLGSVAKALDGIRHLPRPVYSDKDWLVLSALIKLLPVAVAKLREVFVERETVDFTMISMAAIEALGPDDAPTDLMLAFDNIFSHILIDEYQDTSWTQDALLRSLTRGWERGDGRTLFIVGDPMQSIYLFRDADVGLFLKARQSGIADIDLTPLRLSANFRSQKGIVDWVNKAFAMAFPVEEDVVTGAVGYAESCGVRAALDGEGVEFKIYGRRDDEQEARDIVALLKQLPEGESKAMLVRSRSHLVEIIKALKAEGMDYRGEQLEPLGERVVICELLALLRALLHPCDAVAWLALLRARFCGLTLKDIHRLVGLDQKGVLWSFINDDARLSVLSIDGKDRLLIFREKMAKAMALRGRVPIRELLEGLWIELGGPACFESEDDIKDAEVFLDLVSEVRGEDASLLPWLLERMGKLFAASSGEGANPVVLMTIHKAKGLEFDHVILPGLGKTTGRSEKKMMQWLERGEDLLLAPIEDVFGGDGGLIYNSITDIIKTKQGYEELRLFYVAATRARESLRLFGSLNEKREAISGSFLSLIDDSFYCDNIIETGGLDEGVVAEISLDLKRLPADWERPEARAAIGSPAKEDEVQVAGSRPAFDWAGEEARHLGTVVHRYFCRMIRDGLENWDALRLEKEVRHMETMFRESGFGKDEAAALAGKGVEIVGQALGSERGRWLLDVHAEGCAEMAVTAVIGKAVVRMVIDRTFVDDEGVRWIVDYKTGSHGGGGVEDFLAEEKKRYAPQLDRYEQALRAGGEEREIKKALYYPAIDGWVQWQG